MFLFFLALCSLVIGVMLALKSHTDPLATGDSQEFAFTVDDIDENPFYDSVDLARATIEQRLQQAELDAQNPPTAQEENATPADAEQSATNAEEGTSYDDDLSDQDDEVEKGEANANNAEETPEADELDSPTKRAKSHFSHTVESGDKLKDILELSGLEPRVAKSLIKKSPELANLSAGQQFDWRLDENGDLEYLSWLVSEKQEQIFERTAPNQFTRKVVEKQGKWQQDVVKGVIKGGYTESLKAIGLSQRQINQLSSGLQWQISVNRFKKGDRFAILVRREYINGKVTDLGNVEAIHIISGGKSYYAIQAANGRYYSRNGETLGGKGFLRYPLQGAARVSSPFNPRRFHPVTRRIAPHKGVDFGVRTGTPVIAPSDGVVEHIAFQARGAGRYIKIRHSAQYTTVYMHLSKTLVRVGQSVKKGERIALSGNTGRSTGPHLHYEFHINGRPVNPMTVRLPGGSSSSGMSEKDRKAYLTKANAVANKLKL